jgi:hypothetical protein
MTSSRKLAAILAANVAGFSRLMGEEKARIVEGLRKVGAVTASSLSGRFPPFVDHAGRWSISTSTAASSTTVSAEIEKTSKFPACIMDCRGHR